MDQNKLDLYLTQGIYGVKETLPNERELFLGTIRERVIIALSLGQVNHKMLYNEVAKALEVSESQLLLNGKVNYSQLSKYIKMANKQGHSFKIVSDLMGETPIGLVVATLNRAVDTKEIFIKDEYL